ncbi:hypothetical protein DFH06DRAFT_1145828 [Mycena polygramma]|nr:hypothetical protein DFH06DRAFT_1145828 [Mycena polygramma]
MAKTGLSKKRTVCKVAGVEKIAALRGHSATLAQAAVAKKQEGTDPIKPLCTITHGVIEPVVQLREQRVLNLRSGKGCRRRKVSQSPLQSVPRDQLIRSSIKFHGVDERTRGRDGGFWERRKDVEREDGVSVNGRRSESDTNSAEQAGCARGVLDDRGKRVGSEESGVLEKREYVCMECYKLFLKAIESPHKRAMADHYFPVKAVASASGMRCEPVLSRAYGEESSSAIVTARNRWLVVVYLGWGASYWAETSSRAADGPGQVNYRRQSRARRSMQA